MSLAEAEALSLRNAKNMIQGKSKLPSRGHTGSVWLPRLRRKIHYRSGLERRIFLEIDSYSLVTDIESEKLYIQYLWKGARLNYVPDLILKLSNGRVWIIEIKPASLVSEDQNQAKFAGARKFCSNTGDHLQFGILTGREDVRRVLPAHQGISLVEQQSRFAQ